MTDHRFKQRETESGSEPIEEWHARLVRSGHSVVKIHVDSLRDLCAVAEAAKDIRENSKQAIGMEDPFGSQGPPILVGANDWFRLADAVDAFVAGQ